MKNSSAHHEKSRLITDPRIDLRPEQPYMGIRIQSPMKDMKKAISRLLDEVSTWLRMHNMTQVGAPFIRYHVIHMTGRMDFECCIPVASVVQGTDPANDHVKPGLLPAGRYASLVYMDSRNGIKANTSLLEWAAKKGLVWDRWDVEGGDAFKSRIEVYRTDPKVEPKQANWEIEVAIRLADARSA
jgi:effector-binding domain-containing protein